MIKGTPVPTGLLYLASTVAQRFGAGLEGAINSALSDLMKKSASTRSMTRFLIVLGDSPFFSSITTTLRYMHTNSEARSDAIRMAFGRQVGDKPKHKEKTPANSVS